MLEQASEEFRKPPIEIDSVDTLQRHIDESRRSPQLKFRALKAKISKLDDQFILIGPRALNSLIGYYILLPGKIEPSKQSLLVNFGWVSQNQIAKIDAGAVSPNVLNSDLFLVHDLEEPVGVSKNMLLIAYLEYVSPRFAAI